MNNLELVYASSNSLILQLLRIAQISRLTVDKDMSNFTAICA
jgi:hypothetical protein